mmetsp:Transcript_22545/g.32952  ORF Transcript_22545/g.32952 Transcript_22545/m.32952 type:complete len:1155 (+) Transcript_22545:111-3575(+)|eukprot:CAMPEP_0185032990 /NCGR_PEP_ID=MMETSP1103-20130426/21572_1 /TAXON_ID=36769 /ORGANISM="Paraphysomonas bandaiensis, Strain Caron Lab Isolate" /LENGTH=1154 /DNA_ID=CAMNT_0027569109 /DNA_START=20 /DNA_END=3484 /DNA_ORIENTATION=-
MAYYRHSDSSDGDDAHIAPIEFSVAIGVNRHLHYRQENGIFTFQNPIYSTQPVKFDIDVQLGSEMRLKDFLASIPSFSDFSEQQLLLLERRASISKYQKGDVIFYQGQKGDAFYIVHSGAVDIVIQEDLSLIATGDLGNVVNKLTEGCYFGERALMTSEPRAASVRASQNTVCLVFSRQTFEDAISGSNALLGNDINDNVDWSKDHETRSLYKHIEKILKIEKMDCSIKIRRILYELTTAFTPELSADAVIARMVMTIKLALKGDRVGLFMLSEDKNSMILKVSERAKGIRLPIKGLAGWGIANNSPINIPDAYKDDRFDSTMDRRTGYRTRQVLGAPIRQPLTGECVGLLQVNNRLDGSHDPFTEEEQGFMELACEQLSDLHYGRADVFVHAGLKNATEGEGAVVYTADVATPFQVELISFNFHPGEIVDPSYKYFEVVVSLHLGVSQLCHPRSVVVEVPVEGGSHRRPSVVRNTGEMSINLRHRLIFNISTCNLPRAARIHFRVGGSKKKKGPFLPVGWAASPVFDFRGYMDCQVSTSLFEGDNEVPINTTLSNTHNDRAPSLSTVLCADLLLASTSSPSVAVVHSLPPPRSTSLQARCDLTESDRPELERILLLSFNPMSNSIMTAEDKAFLWDLRYSIMDRPELLAAFLMSVQWQNAEHVQEVYEQLDLWEPPLPAQALQLLDRRFMDPKVRAFAVHCLEELDDDELALYMLQLCQQLKFENYADSALSRFLLRRSLTNKRLIGHIFFWQLQSEIYNVDVRQRFIILLQIYIRNCGHHRIELGHQMFVMKRLENVAENVKRGESKSDRLSILREHLRKTVLPKEFQLPLNPHIKVRGIDVEECKVMESKKKPLWLNMINAKPASPNIVLMLKVGDDLRQDILILQLLRVMDDIWRKEGLEMEMMLYDCISTGFERGLLQVVQNATTLGRILMDATNKKSSGKLGRKFGSAMKALKDFDVLKNWIWEQICDSMDDADEVGKQQELEKRTQNFIISTAAYCVASYVLGLGDRHNDNLMMTKSGHFFHIDFGHILGNFKYKMGVKRERAPFVFTHAMKAVMRDDQFEQFVDLCIDVYNILRENAMLLVSLCSLAIPCNLPELQEEKDVMWLYDKLMVNATDEEAGDHFREQLMVSLNTKGTRINDAAHMLKHA